MEGYPELKTSTEAETVEQLNSRVRLLLDNLPARLGIQINPGWEPSVVFTDEASHYEATSNSIGINRKHFNNGGILGEEVAHFLRSQIKERPLSREVSDLEDSADEFWGRLGDALARDVFRQNGYEDLAAAPERDSISVFALEEFNQEVDTLNHSLDKFTAIMENSVRDIKILDQGIKIIYNKLESTDLGGAYENAPRLLRESLDQLSALYQKYASLDDSVGWSLGQIMSVINDGVSDLKTFEEEKNSDHSGKDLIDAMLRRLDLLVYNIAKLPEPVEKTFTIFLNGLVHIQGYVAAEKFMSENPDWRSQAPVLMKQSDHDLYFNYVRSSQIEKWLRASPYSKYLEVADRLGALSTETDFLEENLE